MSLCASRAVIITYTTSLVEYVTPTRNDVQGAAKSIRKIFCSFIENLLQFKCEILLTYLVIVLCASMMVIQLAHCV